MSTLTRQNRIPDYKEYVNFVSGYRNGKKENSPEKNNDFLQKNERKFELPPVKKLVKTEVYLEVNQDEQSCIKKTIKNFENQSKNGENHGIGGVMSKRKIFENKSMENETKFCNKQKWSSEKINKVNATFLQQINKTKTSVKSNVVSIQITDEVDKKIEQKFKMEKNNEKIEESVENIKRELLEMKNHEQNVENIKTEKIELKNQIENHKSENHIENVKMQKLEISSDQNSPPPPPPPPMPNFSKNPPKKTTEKTIVRVENDVNRKNTTLNRADPLVKKLAYGAMLDMYGAYHNKANDYVATLPKNKVKKENGLQKIIDNIAAQGGLEKLSGRSNPKQEND